jgi:H+-transporting ATPase
MAPRGWHWALFVWGYAIAWALVSDVFKLATYRILDPARIDLKARRGFI